MIKDRSLTARLLAEVAADLHFCRESDDGYTYTVFDAFIEGVVYVARVACRQRTEYDENFSRRVCRQVTHATSRHLNGVLQTRLAIGLELVALGYRLEDVLRVTYRHSRTQTDTGYMMRA